MREERRFGRERERERERERRSKKYRQTEREGQRHREKRRGGHDMHLRKTIAKSISDDLLFG